ncbi:hypothetical protein WG66_009633 [Moniliophthora roreri]|nr:hypothetical protein WG66_009633 [Moniliophthora roreri]
MSFRRVVYISVHIRLIEHRSSKNGLKHALGTRQSIGTRLFATSSQGKKTLRTSNRHISAAYISYGITEPQNDSINTMDPKVTRILKRQLSPKHHRPNYSFSNQRAPFYPEDIAVSYPLHLPNAPQLPYVSLGAHPLPLRPYCLIGEQ